MSKKQINFTKIIESVPVTTKLYAARMPIDSQTYKDNLSLVASMVFKKLKNENLLSGNRLMRLSNITIENMQNNYRNYRVCLDFPNHQEYFLVHKNNISRISTNSNGVQTPKAFDLFA